MVSVRELTKKYGPKTVLDHVTLEVDKGQIVAVMGASGGGKTTLLKCIAGLIDSTSGTIEVAGIEVQENPDAARRKMGLVFQSAALFDYMNVTDNILFGVRRWSNLSHEEERKLLGEMLEVVELDDVSALMPNQLSGGMKKRVGIARALAMKPEVMLYDEPTTGLDPVTTYTIDALIARLAKRYGVTSLAVTHDVTSVMRLSDRVAFLDEGKLMFEGTPKEFHDSNYPAIRELVEKSEALSLNV